MSSSATACTGHGLFILISIYNGRLAVGPRGPCSRAPGMSSSATACTGQLVFVLISISSRLLAMCPLPGAVQQRSRDGFLGHGLGKQLRWGRLPCARPLSIAHRLGAAGLGLTASTSTSIYALELSRDGGGSSMCSPGSEETPGFQNTPGPWASSSESSGRAVPRETQADLQSGKTFPQCLRGRCRRTPPSNPPPGHPPPPQRICQPGLQLHEGRLRQGHPGALPRARLDLRLRSPTGPAASSPGCSSRAPEP